MFFFMTHPHTLGVVKFFEKSVFLQILKFKGPFLFFGLILGRLWSAGGAEPA
jgi:hypothetical protein